jgi:2Fe-2S ferredoxin
MVSVTYIAADGKESLVQLSPGTSLMMGAVQNNIRGIDGECGGCLSCATCHVYVAPEWLDRLPEADPMEAEMLDAVSADRRENSRLGCQVNVTAELDGIRVFMPASQS